MKKIENEQLGREAAWELAILARAAEQRAGFHEAALRVWRGLKQKQKARYEEDTTPEAKKKHGFSPAFIIHDDPYGDR